MEVEAKPSPWPCVVMLVGLLLCCLAVPRFWRSAGTTEHSLATPELVEATKASDRARVNQLAEEMLRMITGETTGITGGISTTSLAPPMYDLANSGAISLCPPPTLEGLINDAPWKGGALGEGDGLWLPSRSELPTLAPPAAPSPPDEQWPWTGSHVTVVSHGPNPYVLAALEGIGQAMAAYSVADLLPALASRAADMHLAWFGREPARATLPLAGTGERPAIAPANASTLRLMSPIDLPAAQSQLPAVKINETIPLPPEPVAIEDRAIEPVPAAPAIEPIEPAPEEQAAASPWTVPQTLFDQLDRLVMHPVSSRWARTTIERLHAVMEPGPMENQRAAVLRDLNELAIEATRLADSTSDDRLRVELLRAHWGLSRRLDCWKAICDIRLAAQAPPRVAARGSLSQLFDGPPQDVVLNRPDLPNLSGHLEAYELERDPQLGRQVAQEQYALEASPDALDQSLADAVEQHYRNANIRIAITAELLNRFVAQQRSEAALVRDRIAGTPVRGQSFTRSESRVRLHPATGHWHLDVETQGVVESNTMADGGRARLRSFGATDFVAQKSIVVDSVGVRMNSATVGAMNHARLASVRTEFDWIPLVGAYARDRAIDQYRAKRSRAKREVEAKVAAQAADQVDRETQEAVDRIAQNVRERFTDPIAESGIEITPIELTTTEERLVARLRVAGMHQLGSHTPRPRALSDSLASLQLHESALTNAAVSLGLDGGRFTAVELRDLLRERFPNAAQDSATEARQSTVFEFAYRDAVQFRIDGGRIELLLKLEAFEHEGRRTRNFIVHAFYVPVVNGLAAEFVRDGALGIEGRLGSGDRARLHNVFNTVLAADRRLPIVQPDGATAQRLEGLMITQMVLEDGWIGLAIGPHDGSRVAEVSRSLR